MLRPVCNFVILCFVTLHFKVKWESSLDIFVSHLPGVLVHFSLLPSDNPGASVGLAAGAGVGTGDGGGRRWGGGRYR